MKSALFNGPSGKILLVKPQNLKRLMYLSGQRTMPPLQLKNYSNRKNDQQTLKHGFAKLLTISTLIDEDGNLSVTMVLTGGITLLSLIIALATKKLTNFL